MNPKFWFACWFIYIEYSLTCKCGGIMETMQILKDWTVCDVCDYKFLPGEFSFCCHQSKLRQLEFHGYHTKDAEGNDLTERTYKNQDAYKQRSVGFHLCGICFSDFFYAWSHANIKDGTGIKVALRHGFNNGFFD